MKDVNTRRVLNTLFNPFSDNTVSPAGSSYDQRAMLHAMGLILGWGTVGYAGTRVAARLKDSDYYKDKAKEEEDAAYRSARSPNLVSSARRKTASEGLDTAARAFTSADTPKYQLALALAATLAGMYGGHRIASTVEADNKNQELATGRQDAAARYERLLKKAYKDSRSEKLASEYDFDFDQVMQVIDELLPVFDKEADGSTLGDMDKANRSGMNVGFGGVMDAGVRAYAIYAAALLTLGYVGGRKYFESKSPERAREKELKELKRRLARTEGSQPIMTLADLPEGFARPNPAGKTPPNRKRAVHIEAPIHREQLPPVVKTSGTPVDRKDPYASILSSL